MALPRDPWVPIRVNLRHDPRVEKLATLTKERKAAALGFLVAWFSIVEDLTTDGVYRGSEKTLDRELGKRGVTQALIELGLIDQTSEGFRAKNPGKWFHKSAKKQEETREKDRKRQRKKRDRDAAKRDSGESVTRDTSRPVTPLEREGEGEREEERIQPLPQDSDTQARFDPELGGLGEGDSGPDLLGHGAGAEGGLTAGVMRLRLHGRGELREYLDAFAQAYPVKQSALSVKAEFADAVLEVAVGRGLQPLAAALWLVDRAHRFAGSRLAQSDARIPGPKAWLADARYDDPDEAWDDPRNRREQGSGGFGGAETEEERAERRRELLDVLDDDDGGKQSGVVGRIGERRTG